MKKGRATVGSTPSPGSGEEAIGEGAGGDIF